MEIDKEHLQEQIQEQAQTAMETVAKPFKEWERMRNPWAGWTRVGIGLVSPFVLWSNSIILLAIFVAAIFTHPYWFPPFKEDRPHPDVMTKLVDHFQMWQKTTTQEERLLFYIPGFAIALPYVWFMWTHSLFWGLFFLGTGTAYKVLFAQWLLENPALKAEKAKTRSTTAKKAATAKKKTAEKKEAA